MKSSVGRLGKLGQAYAGRRLVAAASLSSQPYSGAVHGAQVTWTTAILMLATAAALAQQEECATADQACACLCTSECLALSIATCVCTAGNLHLQGEPHAQ